MDFSEELRFHRQYFSWKLTKILGIGLFSLIITIFFFLNTLETVLGKDFSSLVPAVKKFQGTEIIRSIIGNKLPEEVIKDSTSPDFVGDFGNPRELKIPSAKERVPLVSAISYSNEWFSRIGSGQFIIVSQSQDRNIGGMVVYLNSSWRTVSNADSIRIGDTIFVETDKDWRYMFRIIGKNVLQADQPFVKSNDHSGGLVFIVEVPDQQKEVVFEALLINVQNILQ